MVDHTNEVENGSSSSRRIIDPKAFAPQSFDWLPLLPGTTPVPMLEESTSQLTQTASSAKLIDRYRHAQPYTSSTPFIDPPGPTGPIVIPEPTSSFPALLETYRGTADEPTTYMRENEMRRQMLEILRRDIASPHQFSHSDTLSGFIPAPKMSFAQPYDTRDNAKPTYIPINPDTSDAGLMTKLLHRMNSPFLTPAVRERLTSIQPPRPLRYHNGDPVYYGEPVRGPDEAAVNAAKGKPGGEEVWMHKTWDSGPEGVKKWGASHLPTGKKVVTFVEGELTPRLPPGKQRAAFEALQEDQPLATPLIKLNVGDRKQDYFSLKPPSVGSSRTPDDDGEEEPLAKRRATLETPSIRLSFSAISGTAPPAAPIPAISLPSARPAEKPKLKVRISSTAR